VPDSNKEIANHSLGIQLTSLYSDSDLSFIIRIRVDFPRSVILAPLPALHLSALPVARKTAPTARRMVFSSSFPMTNVDVM